MQVWLDIEAVRVLQQQNKRYIQPYKSTKTKRTHTNKLHRKIHHQHANIRSIWRLQQWRKQLQALKICQHQFQEIRMQDLLQWQASPDGIGMQGQ